MSSCVCVIHCQKVKRRFDRANLTPSGDFRPNSVAGKLKLKINSVIETMSSLRRQGQCLQDKDISVGAKREPEKIRGRTLHSFAHQHPILFSASAFLSSSNLFALVEEFLPFVKSSIQNSRLRGAYASSSFCHMRLLGNFRNCYPEFELLLNISRAVVFEIIRLFHSRCTCVVY